MATTTTDDHVRALQRQMDQLDKMRVKLEQKLLHYARNNYPVGRMMDGSEADTTSYHQKIWDMNQDIDALDAGRRAIKDKLDAHLANDVRITATRNRLPELRRTLEWRQRELDQHDCNWAHLDKLNWMPDDAIYKRRLLKADVDKAQTDLDDAEKICGL